MNQSYRSPETPDFHSKSENNHSLHTTNWKQALAQLAVAYPDRIDPYL